jgi:hypothetical protein
MDNLRRAAGGKRLIWQEMLVWRLVGLFSIITLVEISYLSSGHLLTARN